MQHTLQRHNHCELGFTYKYRRGIILISYVSLHIFNHSNYIVSVVIHVLQYFVTGTHMY